jgi:hypothetical protein
MKQFGRLISIIGIPALVLAATAAWGQGQGGGRMFNPKTLETLSGEVVSVEKLTPGKGMSQGVHFTLKTDKETIPVHLGPGWYMEKQGVNLAAGDKVEVTGSRITYEGKPAIIAAEVKKGDQVFKLRDAAGVPAWAGQGRRNR